MRSSFPLAAISGLSPNPPRNNQVGDGDVASAFTAEDIFLIGKFHIHLIDPGIESSLDIGLLDHSDDHNDFDGGQCPSGEMTTQRNDTILNDSRSRKMGMDF